MRYIALFILAHCFCLAQSFNTIKQDSIEVFGIINKAHKKSSEKDVFVIDNSAEVMTITNYIKEKKKLKEILQKTQDSLANNTVGKRYLNGDKQAKGDIISILNRKDRDEIWQVFNDLELDYKDRAKKSIPLDADIKQLLFQLIDDKEIGHMVIQFLGYNRVVGRLDLFEQELLSGNSPDATRLFYWLGEDGTKEAPLDYVLNTIAKKENDLDLYWVSSGLEGYMENGTINIRNKILEIVYNYLDKNPFTQKDWKALNSLSYLSNPSIKETFLKIVKLYGDSRSLRVYKELKEVILSTVEDKQERESIISTFNFETLKYRSPEEKKKQIIRFLEDKTMFLDAVYIIVNDEDLKTDQNTLIKLFEGLEKHNLETYQKENILDNLNKNTAVNVDDMLNNHIKSMFKRQQLLQLHKLNQETFEDRNAYLFELGLIDNPITEQQIEAYKNSEYYFEEDYLSIVTSLEIANIGLCFDTEPNIIPVDYDELLKKFVGITKGKISNVELLMETHVSQDYEVDYTVIAIYNNKCFVMKPKDYDDWYDMETFTRLLGALKEEAQIEEEFVAIYPDQTATFIFGVPQTVEKLITKYRLR